MDSWTALSRVVILLLASAALGVLLRRFGQNAIVGYLLAGVLLGPTGLGLIGKGQQLRQVSEIGVVLLLFSIGLEFSFARIRQIGRVAIFGGLAQILLTLVVAASLLARAGITGTEALVLGAALAMSSTAVMLRVLMDNAELDSRHGRAALGVSLLQDVAVVPLLIASDALAGNLSGPAVLASFTLKMAGVAGISFLIWLGMKHLAPALFARAMLSRIRELPVIVAACMCLGAAAASNAAGFSPAIGAFAAGVILAESPFAVQVRADLTPLAAVFVAIFFASMGTIVTLPVGWRLVWVAAGAFGVMLVKTLIAAGVIYVFLRSLRVALATGLALSQVGEFTFVLADNGHRRGLVGAANLEFLVAVSIVTLIATPYVMGVAPRLSALMLRRIPAQRRKALEPAAPDKGWDRVLVVGYGPAGQQVVAALQSAHVPFLILEFNPNTVAAYSASLPIELGDATQAEILHHVGVGRSRAVVVTVPDPGVSRVIIEQVRHLAPGVPVIARGRYHLYAPVLSQAGAQAVVDEEQLVGAEMARRILEWIKPRAAGGQS